MYFSGCSEGFASSSLVKIFTKMIERCGENCMSSTFLFSSASCEPFVQFRAHFIEHPTWKNNSFQAYGIFTYPINSGDAVFPPVLYLRETSGEYRRATTRKWSKRASSRTSVRICPLTGSRRLWIILRAPTAPCLHHPTMTSCSLAALAWADGHWCLSSPTCND